MLDTARVRGFDVATLVAALLLVAAGLTMVASIEEPSAKVTLAQKQTLALVAGLVLFALIVAVDYHTIAAFALPLYGAGLALLVVVLVIGRSIANTHSWIEFGPIRLQPSEPMKPLTALMLATVLGDRLPEDLGFRDFFRLSAIMGAPMVLILVEPDMGTVLTYIPMFIAAIFLAGLRWKTILWLVLVGALAAPIGWHFVLKEYQKERIYTVIDPSRDPEGIGYQVHQSRIAIGSGGGTGRGFGEGTQSRLKFLPQQHTAFIFAFVAEEKGFLGAGAVLGVLVWLIFRILQTARLARDKLGLHIAALIGVQIAGQTLINLGMVLGLLPTIGVPLPLVSYGGSSVIANLMALGLVASVRMRRFVN